MHLYKYCRDFQNGLVGCTRERCMYMHVPMDEQLQYETTGVMTPLLSREQHRTLQIGGVCRDFSFKGSCSRPTCKFNHFRVGRTTPVAKCGICLNVLEEKNVVTTSCQHALCLRCAAQLSRDPVIRCPMCRAPCSLQA